MTPNNDDALVEAMSPLRRWCIRATIALIALTLIWWWEHGFLAAEPFQMYVRKCLVAFTIATVWTALKKDGQW